MHGMCTLGAPPIFVSILQARAVSALCGRRGAVAPSIACTHSCPCFCVLAQGVLTQALSPAWADLVAPPGSPLRRFFGDVSESGLRVRSG